MVESEGEFLLIKSILFIIPFHNEHLELSFSQTVHISFGRVPCDHAGKLKPFQLSKKIRNSVCKLLSRVLDIE